jgi:hypothetical protein
MDRNSAKKNNALANQGADGRFKTRKTEHTTSTEDVPITIISEAIDAIAVDENEGVSITDRLHIPEPFMNETQEQSENSLRQWYNGDDDDLKHKKRYDRSSRATFYRLYNNLAKGLQENYSVLPSLGFYNHQCE